ncbi:unnamed protein product [Euphydryas editha]|uniref:CCHC-type domain-containing protein n=1 Tax=Euphydryas editha TaxID=104508 RepID=A0AAU9U3W5_EUPED|nr:unnamed protein product [Euphydryas editha]
MEHARPPAELVLEGGPASRADSWRKWLKQFNVFLKASGVYKESKEIQASLLVNLIGSEGYDIYLTFKYIKEEDQDDIDILIKKFNEYFGTKHNTTMARFRFFTRNQEIGETIDTYATALRLLSQPCEFEHLEDGLIRDRIVCGVTDCAVRDRLLRTDDLTLEKTIKICQANEMSNEDSKQIETVKSGESASTSAVDALFGTRALRRGGGASSSAGGRDGRGGPLMRSDQRVRRGNSEFDSRRNNNSVNVKCCDACGISHYDNYRCPATFLKCFLCNNRGHVKRMCPMKNNNRQVHELNNNMDSDLFHVSTLKEHYNLKDSKWYEILTLCKNGMSEQFKLD